MNNDYMTVESFAKSEHFKRLKLELKELTLYLIKQLEQNGLKFKIHTGESYNRYVFWADAALNRNRDRDFLTIFTRRNGLLLWPKFYALGWKSNEADKLKREISHQNQINEENVDLIIKAYKSICERDSIAR
jgi:hypothetical protein